MPAVQLLIKSLSQIRCNLRFAVTQKLLVQVISIVFIRLHFYATSNLRQIRKTLPPMFRSIPLLRCMLIICLYDPFSHAREQISLLGFRMLSAGLAYLYFYLANPWRAGELAVKSFCFPTVFSSHWRGSQKPSVIQLHCQSLRKAPVRAQRLMFAKVPVLGEKIVILPPESSYFLTRTRQVLARQCLRPE